MCGIAGFCFTPDSCLNARELSRTLLLGIEDRGRDASGFAHFDAEGNINALALAHKASEFVKGRGFRTLDPAARTAILHTRLSTKGDPSNGLNNHPVNAWTPSGKQIAAVHNGMLWNDDEKFAEHRLPRYGQVDSEIIPAMIAAMGSWNYTQIFGELEGSIASAWLDERVPGVLHAVRAWDSPMFVAAIDTTTTLGSTIKGVMFASTLKCLTGALRTLGLTWGSAGVKQYEIGEGEHLRVIDGEWNQLVYPFELPSMMSRWNSRSASTMYGAWGGYDDEYDRWYDPTTGSESATPKGENKSKGSKSGSKSGPSANSVTDNADADRLDYVQWWERNGERGAALTDLGDKLKEPHYIPTTAELSMLATVSANEIEWFALDAEIVSDLRTDYMVHMECCHTGSCIFAGLPTDQTIPCPKRFESVPDDDLTAMMDVLG